MCLTAFIYFFVEKRKIVRSNGRGNKVQEPAISVVKTKVEEVKKEVETYGI